MTHYSEKVREFHLAYGCSAPTVPSPMDDQTRYARLQLVTEEVSELVWALAANDMIKALDGLCDIEYVVNGSLVACGADKCGHPLPHTPSIDDGLPRMPPTDVGLQLFAPMLDGCSALAMALSSNKWEHVGRVGSGLLIVLGQMWANFRINEDLRQLLLAEVHRSNMTKFGADGKPVVNEAGRVVKGPNYEPPRLLDVMQGYLGSDWAPPPIRTKESTPLSGPNGETIQ